MLCDDLFCQIKPKYYNRGSTLKLQKKNQHSMNEATKKNKIK